MAEIKRIYVEKKEGCNIEASQLLADIKENLGLTNLTGLRILNRYDVEDIADELIELYKEREMSVGYKYGPDTAEQ